MTNERTTTTIRLLLDELALLDPQDGTPVIILVRDYGEREALVAALVREARIHDVEIVEIASPEEAAATLPSLSSSRNQAAAALLGAGTAAAWGRWLDANRERLPSFCKFLLIFVLEADLPALAVAAPALLSWAKAHVVERLLIRSEGASTSDLADEIVRMRAETGRTPAEFVDAWKRGEVADTYQNNTWLNLARAAAGRE